MPLLDTLQVTGTRSESRHRSQEHAQLVSETISLFGDHSTWVVELIEKVIDGLPHLREYPRSQQPGMIYWHACRLMRETAR